MGLLPALIEGFHENRLLTYASAIAFQVLTGLMPLLLLVLGLLGFFHLSEVWSTDVAPDLRPHVSHAAFQVIDDTVTQVLGKERLFWVTAGAVFRALERVGRRASRDGGARPHLRGRARAPPARTAARVVRPRACDDRVLPGRACDRPLPPARLRRRGRRARRRAVRGALGDRGRAHPGRERAAAALRPGEAAAVALGLDRHPAGDRRPRADVPGLRLVPDHDRGLRVPLRKPRDALRPLHLSLLRRLLP